MATKVEEKNSKGLATSLKKIRLIKKERKNSLL